jgi:hypothetical protein
LYLRSFLAIETTEREGDGGRERKDRVRVCVVKSTAVKEEREKQERFVGSLPLLSLSSLSKAV